VKIAKKNNFFVKVLSIHILGFNCKGMPNSCSFTFLAAKPAFLENAGLIK
jgi:hypothetical protein